MYVLIYADNLIITGADTKQIDDFKYEIKRKLKMRDFCLIS